jgi:hypothetical protein
MRVNIRSHKLDKGSSWIEWERGDILPWDRCSIWRGREEFDGYMIGVGEYVLSSSGLWVNQGNLIAIIWSWRRSCGCGLN